MSPKIVRAMNRLHKWRAKRITLQEIQDVTQISKGYLSQVLADKRSISSEYADKILEAKEPTI